MTQDDTDILGIEEHTYPFPIKQQLSNEYLQENFWKCLYSSAESKYHYWVVLPNGVKATKLEPIILEELNLTVIGQYDRMDNIPYLNVVVAYEYYPFEMNAADWLSKKLNMLGEGILSYNEVDSPSTGKYLDVLTIKKYPGGDDIISRCTVLKDFHNKKGGGNYFLMKASCLEKDYKEQADTLQHIVSHWGVNNKATWQLAEMTKLFTWNLSEKISFYLPDSWEIKMDIYNTNQEARFVFEHTIKDENIGVINAFCYEASAFESAQQVYDKSFDRLLKLDTFLSYLPNIEAVDTSDIMNPQIIELYTASGEAAHIKQNINAFVWVYIIKTDSGWYYFESLGPKVNRENHYWEVNKRCIEMIINTFNNPSFAKRNVAVSAAA